MGDPLIDGYFVQADYIITGERRKYIPRAGAFSPTAPRKNVQQGGPGLFELTVRYSTLNTNSLPGNFNGEDLRGGDMNRIGAFLTWYPTVLAKLQFGYGYVTLDNFDLVDGSSRTGHTHIFQFRFAVLIG